MKVYIGKPPKPGGPERFTIGTMTSNLSDEDFKKLGFEKPLRKLAKHLVRKYPKNEAIGIEFHGLEFNFLLDSKK